MNTLLVINASSRVTRSITRRLTDRFVSAWISQCPGGRVIQRDVGLNPPPTVSERWIAAAFADPTQSTAELKEALQTSNQLIHELEVADMVLIGTPIYNFGMPAQLKAYFDQVIRVGRTFELAPGSAEPYKPLLRSRPVIVVTSAGDSALYPGGALAHMNFLEPHLKTVLGFIGLNDMTFVRVGDEELGGERLQRSIASAETALDALVDGLGAKAVEMEQNTGERVAQAA